MRFFSNNNLHGNRRGRPVLDIGTAVAWQGHLQRPRFDRELGSPRFDARTATQIHLVAPLFFQVFDKIPDGDSVSLRLDISVQMRTPHYPIDALLDKVTEEFEVVPSAITNVNPLSAFGRLASGIHHFTPNLRLPFTSQLLNMVLFFRSRFAVVDLLSSKSHNRTSVRFDHQCVRRK